MVLVFIGFDGHFLRTAGEIRVLGNGDLRPVLPET